MRKSHVRILTQPHASFIPNDATRNATKTIANYVQQSQWRRAYRLLQQSPILPDTIPNRRAVAKLHPQRPPPSPHELRDAEGVAPFKTSRTIFDHVARVANIHRAAGIRCSGAAEMIGIVEVGGGDAIFTIVEALNDGTLKSYVFGGMCSVITHRLLQRARPGRWHACERRLRAAFRQRILA